MNEGMCNDLYDWKDDDEIRCELFKGHEGNHLCAVMGPPPNFRMIPLEWRRDTVPGDPVRVYPA